jgi:hypothetical protein
MILFVKGEQGVPGRRMGNFLPFSVFFGQVSFPQVALWKVVKSVENYVGYAENPYFVDFIRLFSCIYTFCMWKTFLS